MAEIDDKIRDLHDKFYRGKTTDEENQELFQHFKDQVCPPGHYNEDIIKEFLITSHPDYGKPDKDGNISIV